MEKIKLQFSVTPSGFPTNSITVVMTLDENGKSYRVKLDDVLLGNQKELSALPKHK